MNKTTTHDGLLVNPQHVRLTENYLPPQVISSKSISHRKLEALASGGTHLVGGGASYQCISTTDRGAALLLKDYADKEAVIPNKSWKKYMLENVGNWHAYAEEVGYELEEEDIIFVRGTIKTSPRWELASFTTQGQSHEFGVRGQAGNIAKVGLKASSSNSTASGPSIRIEISHCNQYMHVSSRTENETAQTQPVHLLLILQIKCRWFNFSKIEARAGPHRLPDPDDELDPGAVLTDIEMFPTPLKFHGPLDDVLDYILTNSDVKVVIACHEDIYSLCSADELPDDLVVYLRESSPPIYVDEQGVGTIVEAAANAEYEHEHPPHASQQPTATDSLHNLFRSVVGSSTGKSSEPRSTSDRPMQVPDLLSTAQVIHHTSHHDSEDRQPSNTPLHSPMVLVQAEHVEPDHGASSRTTTPPDFRSDHPITP